ncbi:MAG: RHS repeat-associated core domain-containing protein [Candidatus Thiodiazotropha sp.]
MPEAARIGDAVAHSQARLGFIVGSILAAVVEGVAAYVVSAAVCALAVAVPLGTLAAIGVGLALGTATGILVSGPAADFCQSAGESLGRTFKVAVGKLVGAGSPDVFINQRRAVRASDNTLDYANCSWHPPKSFVIEGSETVYINRWNAARKEDHLECEATIHEGSDNVIIGAPPVLVGRYTSREISDSLRNWMGLLRFAAGVAGGSLYGARNLPCFAMSFGIGLGVGLGSSKVLGGIMPHMEYGEKYGSQFGTWAGNSLQGKPVHVPSGAKVLPDETDIDLPGPFPLVWSRFYNSRDGRIGILGQGWATPESFELHFRDGHLLFIGHQGRETPLPDPPPDEAVYVIAEGLKLTRSTGGHYYLSYPEDDLIYYFGQRLTGRDGERLRVQRVMDQHDNGIDYRYDREGRLVRLVSSAGQVLSLHYTPPMADAQPRLREIRQADIDPSTNQLLPGGKMLVRYQFSEQGDLVAVIDRHGRTQRRFAYQNHMMVSQQFPSGMQSHYEWDRLDPLGRVVRQYSDDGEDLRFEYRDTPLAPEDQLEPTPIPLAGMAADGLGPFTEREVTITDQLGRTQRFRCNRHFLVTRYTNPLGQSRVSEWDDNRRLTAQTDAMGQRHEFAYNANGQLVSLRNPLGQAAHIRWHEPFPRVHSVIHYDGSQWDYDYDDKGSLVEIHGPEGYHEAIQVDERGLPARLIDPKGGMVRLCYNERALLTEYTDCSDQTTRYDYDDEDRLSAVTDALEQTLRYEHDPLGRVSAIVQPDGARHGYRYNASDQVEAYTDPLGRVTAYAHNLRGEVVAQRDAADGQTTLEYDPGFRLTGLITPNQARYGFAYDAADRLIEERRIDGTRVTLEYDDADQVVAVTHHASVGDDIFTELEREAEARKKGESPPEHPDTPDAIRTELIRDPLGRLIEKRTPSHHHRFSYDAASRLISAHKQKVLAPATDEKPAQLQGLHLIRFEYDALDNLVAEHAVDQLSGETHTLRHQHDPLGNRIQTLLPDGARALNYLYYGSGHLHRIELTQQRNGETQRRLIADIERDALHQEILRSQGTLSTRFERDPMGRRTASWTSALAVQPEDPWSGGHHGLAKQYRYDPSGELLERRHSQQGRTDYGYDALGRLTRAQRHNRAGEMASEAFDYDPAGNLLDRVPQGQRPPGYVRDNLVRIFEDKRFFYDGHSRLIEKHIARHTVQRFEWDDEHQLLAVHTTRKGVTQTVRFTYDALGRRIAKHDRFATTRFVWEGMRLIEERRGAKVVTYIYEPGSYVPLARFDAAGEVTSPENNESTPPGEKTAKKISDESTGLPNPNIYYFHTDPSGLPEELSDEHGRIRWRASYQAWGNTLTERWESTDLTGNPVRLEQAEPVAIEQNLRYQGQYLDRDTGLHYNTFRFYDPDIGRFISPDPIGLRGGMNLLAYSPNPIRWVDPWGWAFGEKPNNSPRVDKWIKNGGTVHQEIGSGTWVYTDSQGRSVRYPGGHPDFSPHAVQSVDVDDLKGNHGRSKGGDFGKADAKAVSQGGQKADYANNTWHHHENGKTMQEVPKNIHKKFTHTGGKSYIKRASC